jgi:hypothetical protein
MGVVRGSDGRFYEIPDEELNRYAVPEQKVKDMLRGETSGAVAQEWVAWQQAYQYPPVPPPGYQEHKDSAYPGASGPGTPGSGGGPPAP